MSRYSILPTLDADFIKPQRARFQVMGGGVDGGRNGLGEGISIDLTGGGVLTCTFADCFIQAPGQHRYVNWIGARCDGSVRGLNVPILTDWSGPFPRVNGVPVTKVVGIPHSDGSLFTDGSGYSQSTVFGKVMAVVNSGKVEIRVYGADRPLHDSDWFSIYHAAKGWRAYRTWEVLSESEGTEVLEGETVAYRQYLFAITPPLRAPVAVGTRAEFARPLCAMKFPIGFTLPWEIEGFYESRPTIQFVEAF